MKQTMRLLLLGLLIAMLSACGGVPLRGSGDLGLIIERASGHVTLVDTSARQPYARIGGLGDLSHASVVYSRDARYAFIFGRDGGLTKIDLLEGRIVKRIMQSGNAIGGSISQDGRIVVAQNYTPGGIKAFDAESLELLSEVPAEYAPGRFSKVVGLADVPGNKFAYALFDGGEIWVSDFSAPRKPVTQRYPAGLQPYDGLVTPDGRHYLAGLFGEDGDGRPGGAHCQRRSRQTARPHACLGRHDHVGWLDIPECHARGAAPGQGEHLHGRRDVEALRGGRHDEEELFAGFGEGTGDDRVARVGARDPGAEAVQPPGVVGAC